MRTILWFRNDLRVVDNTALADACARAREIIPVFVRDPGLPQHVSDSQARGRFLLDCLHRLDADLTKRGSRLIVRSGDATKVLRELVEQTRADELCFNRDYTPYARRRDANVTTAVEKAGARVRTYKDRVAFEPHEIRTKSGTGFQVYTPYRRAWQSRHSQEGLTLAPTPRFRGAVPEVESEELPSIPDDGLAVPTGGSAAALRRLDTFLAQSAGRYADRRDVPALDGTSRLSPHLRLGTLSARVCIERALEAARENPSDATGIGKWIDELVWREFYVAVMAEHPRVLTRSFQPMYDAVRWDDDEDLFAAWCEGRTGYPFVDAAMRQLVQTGWMHNRARMVTASFLVKDLLIDWRRGERFFMQHLVDGDPASNNGGWQWAASTGTDAQPYFRIFNPVSQGEKFDAAGDYVRKFVPELSHLPAKEIHRPWTSSSPPAAYPAPVVDHAERRLIALERFREARER